jgi:PAS domain S-box-containing protein
MFQLLFERSPDAIWLLDPREILFVDCNEAAVQLMRARDRAQLLGIRPSDLSPPQQPDGQDSATKAAALTALTEEQGTQRFEWQARRLDGTDVPLEVAAIPIVSQGRRLNVVIARDVTERKIAEAALRESELKFRQLFEASSDSIMIIEAETLRCVDCNEAAVAMTARGDRQWLLSQTVADLSPEYQPDGRRSSEVACELSERALCQGAQRFEWMAKRDDGHELPLEIVLTPVRIGGRAFLVSAARDISERKTAEREVQDLNHNLERRIAERTAELTASEQALRDSEQKFRALYEASSQGVILHDEAQMLEVNPACLRILGFQKPEDMVGKHPAETSAPIQPNGERADVLARKYISECMSRGSARFDWLARNCRGDEIPIEIILTRIPLGGRQVIQAVFNDISERKKAEAELRNMLAREKELGELKGNFVSMVSHEFRTPLGIIQSSAEILQDYFERLEPAERAEQLRSIVANTRRMAEMMEEILVLSRLDAGKMEFKPALLDFGAFCRRVVDEVLSATDRRCAIELALGAIPAHAHADDRVLSYIFTNLLTNAVKYSEPGRTVHFGADCDGKDLVCVVRDQGIGIPPADQQWLFQAFQRGSNVGDRPGTGLGLVLVKRCVDLHQGNVEIQSRVGEGTTVTVRLPVVRAKGARS